MLTLYGTLLSTNVTGDVISVYICAQAFRGYRLATYGITPDQNAISNVTPDYVIAKLGQRCAEQIFQFE